MKGALHYPYPAPLTATDYSVFYFMAIVYCTSSSHALLEYFYMPAPASFSKWVRGCSPQVTGTI